MDTRSMLQASLDELRFSAKDGYDCIAKIAFEAGFHAGISAAVKTLEPEIDGADALKRALLMRIVRRLAEAQTPEYGAKSEAA